MENIQNIGVQILGEEKGLQGSAVLLNLNKKRLL